ncbi:MAG TPA: cytochrome c-type biogenesis protein CcmH [Candidatus Eisenbacteria bacterium]|jgi:cytochrome c-type biogenesis protein CcmH
MSAALRATRFLLFGLVLSVALAAAAPPGLAAKKSPEQDITDDIICPCSCGEVLTGCTCDTAKEMKALVARSLAAGKSKPEITQALVAQYGEVVLGAPRAKGFNLVVWLAPFLATLMGFAVAIFLIRRWTARRPAVLPGSGPAEPGASAEQDLEALRARAEEELRRLRG